MTKTKITRKNIQTKLRNHSADFFSQITKCIYTTQSPRNVMNQRICILLAFILCTVWSEAYHRTYYWSTQHMLKALNFAAELIILTSLISNSGSTHLSNEYHMLHPRPNEIYSLRHLTHPSPNFYRAEGTKITMYDLTCLRGHPCFEIKQHI